MTCVLKNIEKCIQKGDRVNFAFQGGEPTLSGLDYFVRFTEAVSKWDGILVSYALQTNAICIDEKWCEFLKKHKFLVGVSFDILPEAHDCARVDVLGKGTYARVLQSIELLKSIRLILMFCVR